MIGDAKLVIFSESGHFAKEPLEYRNRLFQYLVENHGFTAIAIESGITDGRLVHDFVRGRGEDLDEVVNQGIGWTMDRLPQNQALIEWMHQYNTDDSHKQKINFYGFDVPGSPGNHETKRGMNTALEEVLEFLGTVDDEMAESYRLRLAPYIKNIQVIE